jgi:hypothetical protein
MIGSSETLAVKFAAPGQEEQRGSISSGVGRRTPGYFLSLRETI